MRGYVTKTLVSTEVTVKAQPFDGSGAVEIPIMLYGTRKIADNRNAYKSLEKAAGIEEKAVIFGISKVRYLKTVYKMPMDDFLAGAEKIATITSDDEEKKGDK